MEKITAKVGFDAINHPEDVRRVQELLNINRDRVPEGRDIAADGIAGPQTIAAIKRFQRAAMGMLRPDGRVDPGGRTLQSLNDGATRKQAATPALAVTLLIPGSLRFPLRKRSGVSYKTGKRYFGAPRTTSTGGSRAHAGCDLIVPRGTEILAVADGQVLQSPYPFYSGTYALEVRHEGGFVVRYGEIMGAAAGVTQGAKVRRGQVIAYVGQLESGSAMLHLEMYAGTQEGALTVRGIRPFQRRSDLIDPTTYLDQAVLE